LSPARRTRPLLAFRPASVMHRLAPRSEACVLSLRDLLPPLAAVRRPVPLVVAPLAAVMRGTLLACQEARSAVGLALPPGLAPEPWFAAAVAAAEELAPRLPIFLAAEVVVRRVFRLKGAQGAGELQTITRTYGEKVAG